MNTNLAPVVDLPSPSSFVHRQGRTWPSPRLARAVADGLDDGGVVPTLKHFPGLAFAARNTNRYVVRVTGLQERARAGDPAVPGDAGAGDHALERRLRRFDRHNGAGWSRRIGVNLLRGRLGFEGSTITDSLDGTAHARGVPTDSLAVRAARAGTDLILVTGSEAASRSVYLSPLRAARAGRIRPDDLWASYGRILKLKPGL